MNTDFELSQRLEDQPSPLDPTRHRRSATALAVLVSLILTVLSVTVARRLDDARRLAEAEAEAVQSVSAVEQRLRTYEVLVQHVTGLFAFTDKISQQGFARYVSRLRLEKNYAELVRLSYAVAGEDLSLDEDIDLIVKRVQPRTDANLGRIGEPLLASINPADAVARLVEEGIRVAAVAGVPQDEAKPKSGRLSLLSAIYDDPDIPQQAAARLDVLQAVSAATVSMPKLLETALSRSSGRVKSLELYLTGVNKPFARAGLPLDEKNTGVVVRFPIGVADSDIGLSLAVTVARAQREGLPLSAFILTIGAFFTVLLGLLTYLITKRREETLEDLEKSEEENKVRMVLMRELNHRVKNVMATVVSLASLSRRHADSIEDYYEDFSGRVSALSGAHSVLVQSEWYGADIRDLIQAEAAAFSGNSVDKFDLEGPDLELRPSSALTLGLAFHELTTNAAKYGALSAKGGRINIKWAFEERDGTDFVRVTWREHGGPPVAAPEGQTGFGTLLLTKLTARDLSGTVDLRYRETGLECDILMNWNKVKPTRKQPGKRRQKASSSG